MNSYAKRALCCALILFLFGRLCSLTASAAELSPSVVSIKLKQLASSIQNDAANETFELAESLFDELAGLPEFDYLYGYAAQKIGDHQRAIFAYERAIMVDSGNIKYRLALALTYFEVQNYVAASNELKTILGLKPSDKIKSKAALYLTYIEKLKSQSKPQLAGKISIGIGYDSNVSSGVDISPTFNTIFGPDSFAVESDNLSSLDANLSYLVPIDKKNAFYVAAATATTRYQNLTDLNKANLDLAAGYQFKQNNMVYKATAYGQKFWFGGEVYHNLYALLLSADWHADKVSKLNTYLAYAVVDNQLNDDLDLLSYSLGVNYQYKLGLNLWTVGWGFNHDQADTLTLNSQKYQRKVNNLKLGWSRPLGQWGKLNLAYRIQKSKHSDFDLTTPNPTNLSKPLFSEKRIDTTHAYHADIVYYLTENWHWQTQLKMNNKNSNHFFYRYDSEQLTTRIQYLFK